MGLIQFKKPKIRILYNDKDKTELLNWISINIQDNESKEADRLNITLGYTNAKPRPKDKITIYADDNFLGEFVISAIKFNYKKSFEIEAISANFFNSFKTKKNRTFHNQTYTQILNSIAKENGYKIKVDFKRQNEVATKEQYNLSDVAFCESISKELGLTFCVKNNTLIFIDRDKEQERPDYIIDEADIINLSWEYDYTKIYNSVVVKWLDIMQNTQGEAKAGQGEPIFVCSDFAYNEADAKTKAEAKLKEFKAKELKATAKIHGLPLFAGSRISINLSDEPKEIKGVIKKIFHTINADNWISEIEFF